MSVHTFLLTANSSPHLLDRLPSRPPQQCKGSSSLLFIKRIDQMAGCNGNSPASPTEQQSQTVTEKKFGGIAPKKPLISKDHERAYFDSADWVLDKQSASNSAHAAAIESLKPKLKRTPHHQLPPRKPACASS